MRDQETLFRRVIEESGNQIYRICRGYLADRDEVEDLYQEILLNVWKSLRSFRADSKLNTWVFRVAVNTALLYRKRYSRRKEVFARDLTGIEAVAEEGKEVAQEKERKLRILRKCIVALPKQERLIISLSLEGLRYEDIAEVVGIKANYVGVKINRIKTKLGKMISKEL